MQRACGDPDVVVVTWKIANFRLDEKTSGMVTRGFFVGIGFGVVNPMAVGTKSENTRPDFLHLFTMELN